MKKWNTPVIAELDLNKTENGNPCGYEEGWYGYDLGCVQIPIYYNDHGPYGNQPSQDGEKGRGETPDNNDVVNLTSGPSRCGC